MLYLTLWQHLARRWPASPEPYYVVYPEPRPRQPRKSKPSKPKGRKPKGKAARKSAPKAAVSKAERAA
jgi:hypothetical protein